MFWISEMADEKHLSDLQPLENDSAVRGLELAKHGFLLNAPELDQGCRAPQTAFDDCSAIAIDGGDAIAIDAGTIARRAKTIESTRSSWHHVSRVSKRTCWILSVLIIAMVIAIAVGLGVGITMHSAGTVPTTARYIQRSFPMCHQY